MESLETDRIPMNNETLRVSDYIIVDDVPGQNNSVVLHGYTGSLMKIEKGFAEKLLQNRGKEFKYSKADSLSHSFIKNMENQGILTSLTRAEEQETVRKIATKLHKNALLRTSPNIMFVPTYQCNLRCSYCFQPHKMHRGVEQFSSTLTAEQIESAFSIHDDLASKGGVAKVFGGFEDTKTSGPMSKSEIGLFGGEPLMEATLQAVNTIAANAQERGMGMYAVTNAIDLKLFDNILGSHCLAKLQITLDGMKGNHDRRRIGPNRTNTFDGICDSIEYAMAKEVDVSVRINVDDGNIDDLESLNSFFKEKGWYDEKNFMAYAASIYNQSESNSDNGVSIRSENNRRQLNLVDRTIALSNTDNSNISSYEKVARDVLELCLWTEGYPFQVGVNCSAEAGLLIFDPLGDVYSCWEDVGTSERKSATYDVCGIHLIDEMLKSWLNRHTGAIQDCIECPYALIHHSGCAAHARNLTGEISGPACEAFKQYFPRTLGATYKAIETEILR